MSAAAIALAGLVALAVAMGIGRFAFTPILPMMLHDGVVDLHGASWLASANYIGYLVGAVACTFQPWIWARLPRLPEIDAPWIVRAGLVATVLLTLAMALPLAATWPLLRFAAGVASAFVFVFSSGWCLAQLAARERAALGGVMFAGPGAGILASGLVASALVAWHWSAAVAWLVFGLLAALLTATVWNVFRPQGPTVAPAVGLRAAPGSAGTASAASPSSAPAHGNTEIAALTLAYGTAGFGYIVTATFLPVIARSALPGSPWLDLFWPIFGAGVIVGALLATRLRISGDLRPLLAGAYVVQALGIGIGIWSPTLAGFALGSLLLGFPFTAITFFVMQEVRRMRPAHAASLIGLMTAVWGLGQILGPPMVAVLLRRGADAGAAFTISLEIAAATLVAGAALYLFMWRAWPMASHRGAR